MSTKRRLTDDDYTEMAADYEANPPRADEIAGPIEVNPGYLRTGRPAGQTEAKGKTPVLAIRLPEPIRTEIAHRVKAGESDSASEFIRRAVIEYLERHPSQAS
jgi:hypothetical protein